MVRPAQADIAKAIGPVGQGIGVVIAVGRALIGDGWPWVARARSSVGAKQGLRKYGVAGQRQKACSAFASNGSGGRAGQGESMRLPHGLGAARSPERVRAAGKPHLAELLNRTEDSSIVDSVVNFEFNTVSFLNSDGFEIATSIAGPDLRGLAGMTGCLRANRPPTRCCGLHDTGLRLA